MNAQSRMTVLTPHLADYHERHAATGCLVAPDGITCCRRPAAYRAELAPMPHLGDVTPTTFACTEHGVDLRARPDLVAIRSVQT